MSLKKILIVPVAISTVLLIIFSSTIVKSFSVLSDNVRITPSLLLIVFAAICLQFLGHWLRAYKTTYALRSVRHSTTKFQFRALSLGYLFNAILPLRLGEIVRSYVMATADKISWGLSIAVVLFERSVDALFLGSIGLLFVSMSWISIQHVFVALVALLIFGLVVIIGAVALIKENEWLMHLIYRFSLLFNPHIQHSIRFKIWSVIYGLQQIAAKISVVKYLLLSLASWVLYFASIALLLTQINIHINSARDAAVLSASPYYGVSLPSGPASLGLYSGSVNALNMQIGLNANEQIIFDLLSWAVIVLPIAGVGLLLLLSKTKEPFGRKLAKGSSHHALINKLSREEDISDEMELFLENYFSGNALSRIVHRLERNGEFKLLKYFKGGSDAITILAAGKNGKVVVKKIIAHEYMDRLRAQYIWLTTHKHTRVVKAIREQEGEDYYAIDLKYNESDDMFFDYLHSHPIEDSQKVLSSVWESLYELLYSKTERKTDYKALDEYIDKHVWGCLDKAVSANAELALAASCNTLTINGKRYDGIHKIMGKITSNAQIRKDLATFAHAKEVDGDIAIDNILVSGNGSRPLIIDPAPDGNIINGPVFDFGKNMQSLYCGYEFLFRSNDLVVLEGKGNIINFQDRRSEQYVRLCEYVQKTLAPQYLSENEQKAILFHAGVLLIRRLKHQVYQNPKLTLAMYAAGIRTLNDFYKQYK